MGLRHPRLFISWCLPKPSPSSLLGCISLSLPWSHYLSVSVSVCLSVCLSLPLSLSLALSIWLLAFLFSFPLLHSFFFSLLLFSYFYVLSSLLLLPLILNPLCNALCLWRAWEESERLSLRDQGRWGTKMENKRGVCVLCVVCCVCVCVCVSVCACVSKCLCFVVFLDTGRQTIYWRRKRGHVPYHSSHLSLSLINVLCTHIHLPSFLVMFSFSFLLFSFPLAQLFETGALQRTCACTCIRWLKIQWNQSVEG